MWGGVLLVDAVCWGGRVYQNNGVIPSHVMDLSKQLIMVEFKKWWHTGVIKMTRTGDFWTLLIRADLEWGWILISTMWADTWNLSQIGRKQTGWKTKLFFSPTIRGTLIDAYNMVITWNDLLNMWLWWWSTVYDLIEGKYDNLSNLVCCFTSNYGNDLCIDLAGCYLWQICPLSSSVHCPTSL